MIKSYLRLVIVAALVSGCTPETAKRYGFSHHFVLPLTAAETAAIEENIREQDARLAQAKADADAKAAQEAAAREAESRRVAEARRIAEEAQLIAENSPDNFCKDPNVARVLLMYFNNIDVMRRNFMRANDIQHITTVKNDPATGQLACHGNGTALQGYGCHLGLLSDGQNICN